MQLLELLLIGIDLRILSYYGVGLQMILNAVDSCGLFTALQYGIGRYRLPRNTIRVYGAMRIHSTITSFKLDSARAVVALISHLAVKIVVLVLYQINYTAWLDNWPIELVVQSLNFLL